MAFASLKSCWRGELKRRHPQWPPPRSAIQPVTRMTEFQDGAAIVFNLLELSRRGQCHRRRTTQDPVTKDAGSASRRRPCPAHSDGAGAVPDPRHESRAGARERGAVGPELLAGGCRQAARRDPRHPYRAGSLAKPLTTVAVMQRAERGALDVDQPLAGYLPAFSIRSRFDITAEPITVRSVLSHHAGLPTDLNKGMWTGQPLTAVAIQLRASGPSRSRAARSWSPRRCPPRRCRKSARAARRARAPACLVPFPRCDARRRYLNRPCPR